LAHRFVEPMAPSGLGMPDLLRGPSADAEREQRTELQIRQGASPGHTARTVQRLAGLRVRQGRLEEADQLLKGRRGPAVGGVGAPAETPRWRAGSSNIGSPLPPSRPPTGWAMAAGAWVRVAMGAGDHRQLGHLHAAVSLPETCRIT
jgi:hypothetical protein